MRINEMPQVQVFLVENQEAPGGVGEAGLPPVAPASGNAIFAATDSLAKASNRHYKPDSLRKHIIRLMDPSCKYPNNSKRLFS